MNRLYLDTEFEPVILSQLALEDAEAYFLAVDASRDHLSQFEDKTAKNYPTLDAVKESILHPQNPNKLRMGIWDDITFVGSVNLTPREDSAEIGYWIHARETGRGYATLAVTALAKYAKPRFSRIYAEVVVGNEASCRVLSKSGFRETARQAGKLIFELEDSQLPNQDTLF